MATKGKGATKKAVGVKQIKELVTGVKDTVTLSDGTEVKVRVCNGNTLPDLLLFMGEVAGDLNLDITNAEGTADLLKAKLADMGYLLKLIANKSEKIYSLMVELSDVTREQIGEMGIDDILTLLTGIAKVNKDFFIKRVLPMFAQGRTLR